VSLAPGGARVELSKETYLTPRSRGRKFIFVTMSTTRKTRRYRRSTPLGRLVRNVEKIVRHASLMKARLLSWGVASDSRLSLLVFMTDEVTGKAGDMTDVLAKLEAEGFTPPERPRGGEYAPGQRVQVAAKFRAEYEEAFRTVIASDPEYLDDLVVDSVLESGKVVVRRGKKSPFVVSKTHLLPLRESGG